VHPWCSGSSRWSRIHRGKLYLGLAIGETLEESTNVWGSQAVWSSVMEDRELQPEGQVGSVLEDVIDPSEGGDSYAVAGRRKTIGILAN
jgi:hypothetical protein